MIEATRSHERAGHGRFLEGEAADAPRLLARGAAFGLALCLGNVLPHVAGRGALAALLAAVHRCCFPAACSSSSCSTTSASSPRACGTCR